MPITPERRRCAFADSITFTQFVDGSTKFSDEFRANYRDTQLGVRDLRLLAKIDEPLDVLAIVEDWCPDVVANLPILARINDDTHAIRLHVLIRDDANRDIADAYPFEGRSHIPTYVFSNQDGVELGVIVERTAPIRAKVKAFLDRFLAERGLDPATFPAGLDDTTRSELVDLSLRLRREVRDLERGSFVEAIHALATQPTQSSVAV